MADETNTLAQGLETATETVAPETETEAAEQPVSLDANDETDTPDASENDESATPEGDQDPEYVVVDYEGEQFQVPPKLKEALMRHADYTRKTQEVAAERKDIAAAKAEVDQMRNASQEELSARAVAINLDEQMQQYANVDWQALLREDPIGYQEHRLNYETLQQRRGQVAQYLQSAEQQWSARAQQETAKRMQETLEFARTNIKGWTPEVDNQLTQFATGDLGFDVDTLKGAYNPQIYKTLWLAWLGQQSLQKSAAKPVSVVPKPQPLQRVTAKSNPPNVVDLGTADMDAYVAARKRQMGR